MKSVGARNSEPSPARYSGPCSLTLASPCLAWPIICSVLYRKEETVTVYPADVVLFEGILAFYSQEVRDLFQMKLFVDTDADTRLSRRVLRDISERGRDLEQILSQYITFVKPAFEEFCLPTKKYADVIIPRGADNLVAINLIVQHIQDILNGGPSKRQTNGCLNGYTPSRKRQASESSSRPH